MEAEILYILLICIAGGPKESALPPYAVPDLTDALMAQASSGTGVDTHYTNSVAKCKKLARKARGQGRLLLLTDRHTFAHNFKQLPITPLTTAVNGVDSTKMLVLAASASESETNRWVTHLKLPKVLSTLCAQSQLCDGVTRKCRKTGDFCRTFDIRHFKPLHPDPATVIARSAAELIERLSDSDDMVRYRAAYAAAKLHPSELTDDLWRALAARLHNPDEKRGIRALVEQAVAKARPAKAIELFTKLEREGRHISLDAWATVGPLALPLWRNRLSHSTPTITKMAVLSLLIEGAPEHPESIATLPVLLAIFEKHPGPIRSLAISALQSFGKRLIPELLKQLAATDANKRRRAAYACGNLKPAATFATALLKRLKQKDPDPTVRKAATEALRRIIENKDGSS